MSVDLCHPDGTPRHRGLAHISVCRKPRGPVAPARAAGEGLAQIVQELEIGIQEQLKREPQREEE